MDWEIVKNLSALLAMFCTAIGLQKYGRIECDKKISQIHTDLSQQIERHSQRLCDQEKQINNIHIQYAELKTVISYVKTTLDRVDKKIDHMNKVSRR